MHVLDGYADCSLGGNLPRTLWKQKLERIGIDQSGSDKEEYEQEEHDVSHRRHRETRLHLCCPFDCHFFYCLSVLSSVLLSSSGSMSMKSIVALSILNTRSEICEVR